MAFGKRKQNDETSEAVTPAGADPADPVPRADDLEGPFDIEDFDDPGVAAVGRLDLGSVLIPMPEGGQVQVEVNQAGAPSAVWVVTARGRFTVAAYAAPKSAGLWREVAAELAESLRNDADAVSIESGPWGREVVGTASGAVRFIGIDGYRWMIRCVINGTHESIDALAAEARAALADTVVRRGDTPMPVRTPLPVQLPEPMAAQLRAVAEQAAAAQAQQAQQAQPTPPAPHGAGPRPAAPGPQPGTGPQPPTGPPGQPAPPSASAGQPPTARRGAGGSAMQQLRGSTDR